MARRGSHQVEAGLVYADLANFHATAKQGKQPDGSGDLIGVKHWFRAVSRIFRNA